MQRGLYFEITYSGLIMSAQVRRQMISNAKVSIESIEIISTRRVFGQDSLLTLHYIANSPEVLAISP